MIKELLKAKQRYYGQHNELPNRVLMTEKEFKELSTEAKSLGLFKKESSVTKLAIHNMEITISSAVAIFKVYYESPYTD